MQNCPLFSNSKIVLKEKQLQTLKVLYDGQDCKHADHEGSDFFSKLKPKNSPVQWCFTSDGRGMMRYESAEKNENEIN